MQPPSTAQGVWFPQWPIALAALRIPDLRRHIEDEDKDDEETESRVMQAGGTSVHELALV